MQQDFVNTMNDFGKQAMDAAQALGELNSQIAEQVLAYQLEVANLCVEGGVKQLQASQDVKDVKDYLSQQSQLVQEYTDKFMALTKNQVNLAQSASEKYQSWFEQGVKQVNTAAKPTAKKAKAASADE